MFKTGEIVYVFGDMDNDGFYQVSGGLYICHAVVLLCITSLFFVPFTT